MGLGTLLPLSLTSSLCSICMCRERMELVRCVLLVPSAHHKHSRGGRHNNGEYPDRGREKAGSRTDRGLAQAVHAHSRRSGGISHDPEHHMCPHPMTSQLSSSWTARTREVATSDLGGTCRTKAGTIWQAPGKGLGSRWERKRGTSGLLLPAKENLRSQCSGCQPVTACLEGRVSQNHRTLAMSWLNWLVYTI